MLAVVKSNLALTPPSLAYSLVSAGTYGAARVLWLGETAHSAHSLLEEPDEPGAATEAERWLEDYLMSEGGSVKSKDAKQQAAKVGITERTLQRAAKKLRLTVESHDFPRVTFWSWPVGQATPTRSQNVGATVATVDDQQKSAPPETQSRQSRQDSVTGATVARQCPECGDELTPANWTGTDLCIDCWMAANDEEQSE